MERITEYRGPGVDDYANVLALNTAFIAATTNLKGPQRGRLAAAPFLLLSLRENESAWWEEALTDRVQADFLAPAEQSDPELRRIQTAAMSFLWHLSRRNPYAVRSISGAPITWCDKIADLPLVTLLNRLRGRADLMKSRIESPAEGADRLLSHGTSSARQVRHASHLTVLQEMLTRNGQDKNVKLPAAACSMSRPLRVMDKKV
jgi:hypothetical protein